EVIGPFVNEGFLNVDLSTLKNNLQNTPWIAQADVQRIWPDSLVINIVEYKPVAIWNDSNLLSSEGIVFTPASLSSIKDLPHFSAPSGQQLVLLNAYKQIAFMLANLGLQITEIDLSPRLALKLRLNNGMELILGHENVFDRIQRFIKVYPRILDNKTQKADY